MTPTQYEQTLKDLVKSLLEQGKATPNEVSVYLGVPRITVSRIIKQFAIPWPAARHAFLTAQFKILSSAHGLDVPPEAEVRERALNRRGQRRRFGKVYCSECGAERPVHMPGCSLGSAK